MMLKEPVSDSVVRRLPRYYRYLSELERAGVERTSSQALATQLGSTASQIRQDLNCFGGFGHQGYGYHVSDLRTQLGRIIGLEQCMPAVLIGAGHLGSVIAVNIDFPAYGFYLTGIFDIVPTVCGQVLGGLTVQHMTQLSDFCEQVHPAAAVLCIPEHAAQAVADEVWMLENSVYSVISPEGCASILWKDSSKARFFSNVLLMSILRLSNIARSPAFG